MQHAHPSTATTGRETSPVTLSLPLKAIAAAVGLLLAAVVLGAYGFASAHADRVFPGVRAAGVPVGGLSPDAATRLIDQRARALASQRLQLRAGEATWQPSLAELGLTTNTDEVARRALGFGRVGSPFDRTLAVATALTGPRDVGGPTVAPDRVRAWVANAAREFDRPAVDARLEILPSAEVRLSPEAHGRRLDQAAAVATLERALEAWAHAPADEEPFRSVLLRFETIAPRLTAAELAPTRDHVSRVLAHPLTLSADADRFQITPAELAASLRVELADGAPSLAVDEAALARTVERLAALVDRPARDASLSITSEGAVRYAPDQPGRRLDRAATADTIRAAALRGADGDVPLPVTLLPAALRAEHLADAHAAASRALAGPLRLTAGDKALTLTPKEIAGLLTLENAADGRTRVLRVDPAPLRDRLAELAKEVNRPPRHARIRLEGGAKPPAGAVASLSGGGPDVKLASITEGRPGQELDLAAALALIGQRLTGPERVLALPMKSIPAYSAADRAALGDLTLLEWATTSYAGGLPERNYNIELAAERLDGIVVPPGQSFSFNEALGPTTIDTGFKTSWGIMGGEKPGAPPRTVPSVGGGICQVATTLFHAVFWGGYQVDERNWHLYWIPKYGAPPKGLQGLDATVDYDSGTDFAWTNNSDKPVVIQARTDGGRISFGLYGTDPGWKVAVAGPFIDRHQPTTAAVVEQKDPSRPAGYRLKIEEARDGFRSTVTRTVTAADGQPRRASFVSEYVPSRHVWIVGTGGR